MNEQEIRFIENNLQLCNREIGLSIGRTEGSVRNWLYKNQITRTQEQLVQIRLRVAANNRGENNGNWREGRSKNFYYYKKRMMNKYPEKNRARQILYRTKKRGDILPEPCFECGTTENIQAHHPDYSEPLEVCWLCSVHHRELHQREREQGRTVSETDSKLVIQKV